MAPLQITSKRRLNLDPSAPAAALAIARSRPGVVVQALAREWRLGSRLEHQPRTFDARAFSVVYPARHHIHETITLSGEGLQGPGHLFGVSDEDHTMLLGDLLHGSLLPCFFAGDGLGQELLPLGRLGLQVLSLGCSFCLVSFILLTPLLYMIFDSVQEPLDRWCVPLTHLYLLGTVADLELNRTWRKGYHLDHS